MIQIERMIEQTSMKYDKRIKQMTMPLIDHLGIHYFCYQYVSHMGMWFTLGNQPEWLLYSAEHQFYRYDPSLVKPKNYPHASICYPKNHQHNAFQETLIHQAAQYFDIHHCLAMIEPTANGCEYYFFAAPADHTQIMAIYLNQLNRLRYDYIAFIRKKIKPILEECLEQSVSLQTFNAEQFNSRDNILELNPYIQQGIDFHQAVIGSELTSREWQCLSLYQQGLTAKETAKVLHLSYRTIEDHIEHIKHKYGVQHKRELMKIKISRS